MALLPATQLKTRVDLRRVVAHFWGAPERERRRYAVYASRWRDDGKRPSFTVYAEYFKDYGGDGISGDVYEFLMLEMGVDFKGAVSWLMDYTGQPTSYEAPDSTPTSRHQPVRSSSSAAEPPPMEWQAAAIAALKRTQRILKQTPAALDYLRRVRGLTDATIREAGYGYNPDWLRVDWINPDTGRHAYLPPGIVEPWVCDGVLWALRVRCRVGNLAEAFAIHGVGIEPDRLRDGRIIPKYLNLAGSKQSGALYNGDAITPGCDLLIVEGGFDARLAGQILDDQVVVVTFGSATNRPTARRLHQLKQAGRVFLLLDSDEAGQTAQSHLVAALDERARQITLPNGKDITDFVQAGGDLHALMEAAATTPSRRWWRDGLPDAVRSALLRYFRPTTAPVIELINTALNRGLLDADAFTVDDLQSANLALDFNISDGSLRRVLNELDGHFLDRCHAMHGATTSADRDSLNDHQQRRGRQKHWYSLRSIDEVKQRIIAWATPRIYERQHPTDPASDTGIVARPTAAMMEALGYTGEAAVQLAEKLETALARVYAQQENAHKRASMLAFRKLARLTRNLESLHSTPLPEGWPLANGTQYRAAFLRATNDPNERRSRRQIRELLGIANGSVDVTVQRAGLEKASPEGDYEIEPLRSAYDLERKVRFIAGRVKGCPMSIISHHASGKVEERGYRGNDSAPYIAQSLADGAQVFIKLQVANRFQEVTDQPPAAALPLPENADESRIHHSMPPKGGGWGSRRRKFFGTGYDPMWLSDQLTLALRRVARIDYRPVPFLVDQLTGELLNPDGDPPDAHRLFVLLLPELLLTVNSRGFVTFEPDIGD